MKKILLFLTFLLATSPAFADFLQVATSTQNTGTGSSVVITTTASTVNDLMVVHIKTALTCVCSSVTDGGGNTYVLSSAFDNADHRIYQAYGVQITGGVTAVTVNFDEAISTKRVGADEYSGGAITNTLVYDTLTTGTGTGTSLAVSTLTTAATGELIVATMSLSGSQTFTAGSNYTLYNGVNPITMRSEYRLSSGATETAPATTDGSRVWSEIATAFKPFSGTTAGFFGE